jgi:hypothetical protein
MSRRPNQYTQEPLAPVWIPTISVAATTTMKLLKVPYACVVDKIRFHTLAGLAAHASNNFKCMLQKTGSVDLLSAVLFDTDADDGAALTADAFVDGALSAVAGATTLAADDVITAVFTLEGTQTMPVGHFEITLRRIG